MDKQKQIEEMAYVLYKYGQTYDDCVDGAEHNIAKHLVNAGYRKIPENAVVLTREAYNRLFTKARQSEIKTIDLESIVNARKETAEKFAERLKTECFDGGIDDKWVTVSFSRLDEICKEITEGKV